MDGVECSAAPADPEALAAANPDVFLRLEAEPGDGMLDETTKFALKRRLDRTSPFRVVRFGKLESEAGLEAFRRV